jgi:lysophospholipase L1-like esterase
MRRCLALLLCTLAFPLLIAAQDKAKAPPAADRWEPAIAKFEARDKESPPPQGGIVFIGSSSIVGWDLKASFPKLPAINRGFGGSQLADSVRYAPRIVLPYKPRTVVLYAGDNDINAKKTPQQVAAAFDQFVRVVQGSLPKTKIIYIGCKPSPRRWTQIERQREANRLIRAACKRNPLLTFVDVEAVMLGPDGQPKPEIFKPDQLHMNASGYQLWAKLLQPLL